MLSWPSEGKLRLRRVALQRKKRKIRLDREINAMTDGSRPTKPTERILGSTVFLTWMTGKGSFRSRGLERPTMEDRVPTSESWSGWSLDLSCLQFIARYHFFLNVVVVFYSILLSLCFPSLFFHWHFHPIVKKVFFFPSLSPRQIQFLSNTCLIPRSSATRCVILARFWTTLKGLTWSFLHFVLVPFHVWLTKSDGYRPPRSLW